MKTLRGHEASVTTVLVIRDVADWDNPRPPKVISLCSEGKLKCWNALEGKELWSLDDGTVSAIAADDATSQFASYCAAYGIITIRNLNDFTLQNTLSIIPGQMSVSLKYQHLGLSKLPKLILMGYIAGQHPRTSCINIWDPSCGAKPLVQLQAPPYRGAQNALTEILNVSKNGLLAINNINAVHVWSLGILTPEASPVLSHTTVQCDSAVTTSCWLHNNCLATHCDEKIEIWDVNSVINQERVFLHTESTIYTPLRSINTSYTLTCLCSSNQVLLAGDSIGNVHVLDPTNGNHLNIFSKPPHDKEVTDICADGVRVVSCSKDFSIRVYRWKEETISGFKLESLYTLLGGSVAHKNHDGFWKVICTPTSCLGVCGNQIKIYTFTAKLTSD